MPRYQLEWPWTGEEDGLSVYLLARGFEIPDVARILSYRLQRPLHNNKHSFNSHIERINLHQAQRGLPRLCKEGLADWNIVAVDNFLLRLTDDTDALEKLLWFHAEYIPLLHTVRQGTGLSWMFVG